MKQHIRCKEWSVGYHGTVGRNAASILLHGLRRPGEAGVESLHGQAGSSTMKTIYLSPSIEYAAFPVYAQLFPLEEADLRSFTGTRCPAGYLELP